MNVGEQLIHLEASMKIISGALNREICEKHFNTPHIHEAFKLADKFIKFEADDEVIIQYIENNLLFGKDFEFQPSEQTYFINLLKEKFLNSHYNGLEKATSMMMLRYFKIKRDRYSQYVNEIKNRL